MDKVHTPQLEGYRKFEFMLLCTLAAPSGECSYYVDATRNHHVRIMQDFTPFSCKQHFQWDTYINGGIQVLVAYFVYKGYS